MLRAAALRGLPPEAFWRLSLKEWRMLSAPPGAAAPMARTEFERLAEAWPDG
ncbi:MAG: phage tail assembly chaperone [Brevundimonas sp.]|jgi:uncharacterized phage protein (TIGR02216 family)|nr:phage tail assembly chaperone [Brevundimonas sp.]